LQELNVYFGGKLGDVGDSNHLTDDDGKILKHYVNNCNGFKLKELFDIKDKFKVNSLHIHKITKISDFFEISFISDDNIIEGIESFKDNQYIIATQFHPEIMLRYKNKYAINFWNNLRKDLINIKRKRN
jgi:Predicted glutamine amidotransferases